MLQQHAVVDVFEAPVRHAEFCGDGTAVDLAAGDFVERCFLEAPFTEAHENSVAGDAVQPGGESGLAAKVANAAKNRDERVLGEILGLRRVLDHAKTERVDTSIVATVQIFKPIGIALLGETQGFGFGNTFTIELHEITHLQLSGLRLVHEIV